MLILISCILLVIGVFLLPKYIRFRGSDYKAVSGNNFFKTVYDTGNYGEFLTFIILEKLNVHRRLLTNLYIPRKDGSTTEVDLIMLTETGIYVLESKNFSGWIFGDEKSKNWMQTLKSGKKFRFFNPIWQNKAHINALRSVVEIEQGNLYRSYIIFSERCTLKNISFTSENLKIVKRNALMKTIKSEMENSPTIMTKEEVDNLYLQLKKYGNADKKVKKTHVENIKVKRINHKH